MRAAYELRREYSKCLEGHCKDGANDTAFLSGDVRPGYTNGPKEGEKDASFGSVEVIVESDYISYFHVKIFKNLCFQANIRDVFPWHR
jgi:hypothetical protein